MYLGSLTAKRSNLAKSSRKSVITRHQADTGMSFILQVTQVVQRHCRSQPVTSEPCACSQMRLERIKALRWQGRSLPEDVKSSMSTAELQVSLHSA